jgi:hypothetical protein
MTIDRNNYEEYFLLYIDGELTNDQRRQVEDFVTRHPDLEQELEILKQTVVIPPTVVFDGKASLIRGEKERRMVPVYLWRVAAALIILLAGAWFFRIGTKPEKILPVADGSQPGIVPKTRVKPVEEKPAETRLAYRKSADIKPGSRPPVPSKNRAASLVVEKKAEKQEVLVLTPATQRAGSDRSPEKTSIPHAVGPDAAERSISTEAIRLPLAVQPVPPIAPDSSQAVARSVASHPVPAVQRRPGADSTSTGESILVFDNRTKAVSGFLKRLTTADPRKDLSAAGERRRISVSVFQFNIKK